MIIYHNPRCRKSREALQLLQDNGVNPQIVEYLKTPLTHEQLDYLLNKLQMEPLDLIRKNEPEFRQHFKGKDLSRAEWIEAMVRFPKLMQRPIVEKGGKAVLGRPPEKVLELL